ncbi:YeeE/YedE family protein [Aquabacterium sp.]|uniref:YeeE/YedE family protein n=1 Tax=Aquabacterium sp. TaxID=1872578 RepID=UPI002605B5A5|nr:YeeE/YedE family protein [Aquabacterium sp.]MDD2977166.1 YeeE/YedE family protein [Aquabacterium sp.]
MMQPLVSLVAGVVFGLGLAVAEMTNPLKVLDFLDLAGNWDPSLAFVMGGAVLVTLVAFRFVLRRPVPLYGDRFHLPTLTQLDRKLLGGAALFGIGWGLAGYCPGPALATILSGNSETWLFVPAMLVGGALQRWQNRRTPG